MYAGGGERGKRLYFAQRMNQKDTDQNNEHIGNENLSPVVGWTQGLIQPLIPGTFKTNSRSRRPASVCICPFYYFRFVGLEMICWFILRES